MILAAALLLARAILASPVSDLNLLADSPLLAILEGRQSCPEIHLFGARETTAPAGFGTAGTVINLVTQSHSGATSEAISYPACGGQASCGGVSYRNSVQQGVAAAAAAINAFNTKCPGSKIVLVGYSQGAQLFDDAFCGGGDASEGITDTSIPIQESAIAMIKAAIFMGDPRFVNGLSYNVGTCTAQGFAARPAGFQCPNGNRIQSYCDSTDPFCCKGNDPASHQQYGNKYGQDALAFINEQLSK